MNPWFALTLTLAACGPSADAPASVPAPTPAAPAPPAAPTPPPTPSPAGTAEPGDPVAGEVVYTQTCQACHQADGTGMGGMLGANFVADPTRLAKSDEELMKSITEGLTGKIGTMPPWGPTLSEKQRRDALAYIRSKFGKH